MIETVNMPTVALQHIMTETFNYNLFDQGRQKAYTFFKSHPEQRAEKIAEIKRRIENRGLQALSCTSYWLGCLSEADFS